MSRFLIYGLVDPRTGAVRYVGKSANGLERPRKHEQPAGLRRAGTTHKGNWIRSLVADGSRPGVIVLEAFTSAEPLNDAECFWIAQGRGLGWPLTNLAKGGEGGDVMSPAGRARVAEANRRRVITAETRAKKSAAAKGKKHSPEWCANISASKMGHPVSEETREKLRLANIGRKASAETRAKMSAAGFKRYAK